jgi:hypothetical protein
MLDLTFSLAREWRDEAGKRSFLLATAGLATVAGSAAASLRLYGAAVLLAGLLGFGAATGARQSRAAVACLVAAPFLLGYAAAAHSTDALQHLLTVPAAAALAAWLGAVLDGLFYRTARRG